MSVVIVDNAYQALKALLGNGVKKHEIAVYPIRETKQFLYAIVATSDDLERVTGDRFSQVRYRTVGPPERQFSYYVRTANADLSWIVKRMEVAGIAVVDARKT